MCRSGRPTYLNAKSHARQRVTIICEGQEECLYIKHLDSLNVWSSEIYIVTKDASSVYKIRKKYQQLRSDVRNGLILIFCDAGEDENNESRKEFEHIIGMIEQDGYENPFDIVYFANPCTMQIILSHFGKANVKYEDKSKNAKLIEQLTGVKNYDGSLKKINELMRHITKNNYQKMKENLSDSSTDYKIPCSTNILKLLEKLETMKTIENNTTEKRK